jgi:hypothetical protein
MLGEPWCQNTYVLRSPGRFERSAAALGLRLCDGIYGEGYRNSVQMYEPGEDDVVEYGGEPMRLPGWARRPRWFPALGWRPSRGAAIFGIAGLVVGLAAGYALGYRHLGQAVQPSRAAAAGAVPSAVAGSAAPSDPAATGGSPGAYSSSLGVAGLTGLAQAVGACSVQRGRELQVGVEVINPSATAVTLGRVRPILPLGGLRLISQQWAPCGAWQAPEGGVIAVIGASTGEVEAKSAAGAAVLPPYGTAWLSVTFGVLVACPRPLPVQFSVSYQENGRTDTAQLPGFPDLGQVTYTGCKGSS